MDINIRENWFLSFHFPCHDLSFPLGHFRLLRNMKEYFLVFDLNYKFFFSLRVSANQLADKVEMAVFENLKPLLVKAQVI